MSLERIAPDEALDRMDEGWIYVDVRTTVEFEGGHPEGAYNVPWMTTGTRGMVPNAQFMDVMQRAFGTSAKIIVGCQVGGRSKTAAEALLAAGFEHVVDQLAGMAGAKDGFGQTLEAGWMAMGLPIALEPEPGRSYAELTGSEGHE